MNKKKCVKFRINENLNNDKYCESVYGCVPGETRHCKVFVTSN